MHNHNAHLAKRLRTISSIVSVRQQQLRRTWLIAAIVCLLVSLIPISATANITNADPTSQSANRKEQACLSTCVHGLSQQSNQPIRVVALNWSAIEMLLSLGIEPVGVTQGKGYRQWQSNHPALPESITEVGRRQEPDLVAIAQLQPDLIIGYDFRHARLYQALSSIAPTLLYQQFPRPEQDNFRYLQAIPQIYSEIAKAVGKTAKAQSDLAQMNTHLSLLKQQLSQAGLAQHPVTYGKFVGMGYGLRVFTDKSLAGSIATKLGLDYQWHTAMPGKDFTHLQLEQMPHLNASHILLAENQSNNQRILGSPVWQQLPFVKNNAISNTPALWSFGGPVSVQRMATAFTESLLQWQQQQTANAAITSSTGESS